jgi:hypothetical protein
MNKIERMIVIVLWLIFSGILGYVIYIIPDSDISSPEIIRTSFDHNTLRVVKTQ